MNLNIICTGIFFLSQSSLNITINITVGGILTCDSLFLNLNITVERILPWLSVCLYHSWKTFISAQAVLIKPFLKVWTPSTLRAHWAALSLAIRLSSDIAHTLLLASCWLPGPTWCSLERRHSTFPFTATMDNSFLTCPTNMPSSASLPGLPSWRPVILI